MYDVTADREGPLGQNRPGAVIFKDIATDVDALCPGAPSTGIAESGSAKPAIDPDIDSGIDPGIAFLGGFGISRRALYLASRVAAIRGTAAHDELVAADVLGAQEYWACLAAYLGLPFVTGKDALALSPAAPFVPSEALRRADRLMVMDGAVPVLLIAPAGAMLSRFRGSLEGAPQIAHRIRIAAPETIRSLLLRRQAGHYAACAVQRLRRASAASSAFGRPGPVITSIMVVGAGLFAFSVRMAPAMTLFAAAGLMSLIFFNSVLWKLAAALHRQRPQPAGALPEPDLPAYTIMVPLYREANVIADLITSLAAIDYPRVKLQVLLIAEADDHETIAAIARAGDDRFELVCVPPAAPRTKPKALVFALPFARGDFVVVYDAEDRPEPGQLRQAASAFAADPGLGCVQARLTPDNAETWLSAMFTIEYAANFDILLPALADWRLPLPLGGTSNHFPRRVLQNVGAWDPFNVTEDADLGLRIARNGYRIGMIASRTYEEAPVGLAQWLPQRRRWLKGWMQTLLVTLDRRDRRYRHLSWGGALLVHGLLTGGIVSLMSYPLMFAWPLLFAMPELRQAIDTPAFDVLIAVSLFNVGAFVLAALVSALRGLSRIKRLRLALLLPGLPVYYLLMSLATWQALGQLLRAPSAWEKTNHGVSRRRRTPGG
jgi:cellulose synthase/poly-beta-1,6-N-acetylglucosamine synthase-like glycosyltransferase